MSYQRFRSIAEAKRFTEQLDAERRVAARAREAKLDSSREWLERYRASPRPTSFDWRPKLPAIKPVVSPVNPQELRNGKEIEGEFTVLADADAASPEGAAARLLAQGQVATSGGGEAAPRQARAQEESEGPYIPF